MRTYGRVDITGEGKSRRFVVTDMPPHAAIFFKRIFPKIGAFAAPPFELSAIDATARDIDWFTSRFPLALTPAARQAIGSGIDSLETREEAAHKILMGEAPAEHPAFREGESPFPYQAHAAALCLNQRALLLCDDVGLGKTVSAMALLAQGAPRPAAVVVQPHLSEQWADEVEALTTMSTHVVTTTKPYKLPDVDLVIFRYSNIGGWAEHIAANPFRTAIWDEIQELRHGMASVKGRASRTLALGAEVKMGLTATPIFNYGDEIFNVVQFLVPDALGSEFEFRTEWCGGDKVVKNPTALGHYLRDSRVILRRTEVDVDQQQPKLNLLPVEVDVDGDDGELDAFALELAQTLVDDKARFQDKGRAARELDAKMRHATGVAKAKRVGAYVKMLLTDVDKVVVGAWHRDVYEILLAELAAYSPVLYTGSENAKQKRESKRQFIEGDSRVLLISTRSGAGLNGLQHVCSDCVLAELDWSPQIHKQLFGRLRRYGQTKQVTGHVLWADWGSDPSVMDTLGFKADQSRGIVDVGDTSLVPVTEEGRIRRLAENYLATRKKAEAA